MRTWTRYAVVCHDPCIISEWKYPARRVFLGLADAERYVRRAARHRLRCEIHVEVGP